jgi:UDP-glucuronate 4-epimerase
MAYFSFTRKIMNGEPIPVFAQGELRRDFTYIADIVEGVVRLLFKPTPAQDGMPAHSVFNIGNHQPVRVMDFIATLEKVLGRKAVIEFLPMQPGDVPATYADTARLRDWVGFAPATPLAEGLAAFRDWYNSWSLNSPPR